MKWLRRLLARFDDAAAVCVMSAHRTEKAAAAVETMLSKAELDRFAAHANQMGQLLLVMEKSADRMNALLVALDTAHKGFEHRLAREIRANHETFARQAIKVLERRIAADVADAERWHRLEAERGN